MVEAEPARGIEVRDWLDEKDDVPEAVGEGRRQPLERVARDLVDLRCGRHAAGQALGGSHPFRTRDGRYARQPCPCGLRLLDGRPSSAILLSYAPVRVR